MPPPFGYSYCSGLRSPFGDVDRYPRVVGKDADTWSMENTARAGRGGLCARVCERVFVGVCLCV